MPNKLDAPRVVAIISAGLDYQQGFGKLFELCEGLARREDLSPEEILASLRRQLRRGLFLEDELRSAVTLATEDQHFRSVSRRLERKREARAASVPARAKFDPRKFPHEPQGEAAQLEYEDGLSPKARKAIDAELAQLGIGEELEDD